MSRPRPAARPAVTRRGGGRDRCAGCLHPRRAELDAALVAGASMRDLAARFGMSRSAVHRHKAHLSASLVPIDVAPRLRVAGSGSPPVTLDEVLAQAQAISAACRDNFDRALEGGNLLEVSLAAREARAGLDLLGRLLERAERMRPAVGAVDVLRDPKWVVARTIVMEELDKYAGARLRVSDRLAALERDDEPA